ncbi:uncharacterized protein LDX57_007838 [Aspergillus melleus]|uniref:uncharacterized protein n=1 Tax=Aspergillus melleus TaxID=138277 RepID=UPI001E8EAAAF|nr:uncharacterized protein LDX57_007838 [Aspergillus melleus]KAH8430168.1 hypothetical protein LDX57_007838 [Aspergillus melleus]
MAAWLDLSGDDAAGWSLVDTGRMDDIVQSMSHPATQYPSVLSFLGNDSRVAALRALFPQNNVTRRGPAGLVRLHLSTTTANTEHPVCAIRRSFSTVPSSARPIRNAVRHQRPPPHETGVSVDARSVFLCGRRERAEGWLAETHGDNHASPADTPSLVRVILILTDPTAIYNADPVEAGLPGSDVAGEQRPTISVLDLRDRHQLSPSALYAPLQRLLLDRLQDSRAELMKQGLLFSAVHLKFMWNRCLAQSLLHPAARINCLSLSRERLPVPFAFHDGLAELLGEACKVGCPIHERMPTLQYATFASKLAPVYGLPPSNSWDDGGQLR